MKQLKAILAGAVLSMGASLSACTEDLGPCDQAAAEELVYGRNGLVATKGQALLHDSCGNGVFCHSSAATGGNRFGAPAGMDFDMLPKPKGWPEVTSHRHQIWTTLVDGMMPPPGVGTAMQGDGDWAFDSSRSEDAPRLPSASTHEGKAALRNWLACESPVVAQTEVPAWAQPPKARVDGGQQDWMDIYDRILQPKCATAGCHNAAAAGGLAMTDPCDARQQLLKSGACGKARVVPGTESSFLLEKLGSAPPCGGPMPPTGPLPAAEIEAIRSWVQAGATAMDCE